jgi:hypothetical protein
MGAHMGQLGVAAGGLVGVGRSEQLLAAGFELLGLESCGH